MATKTIKKIRERLPPMVAAGKAILAAVRADPAELTTRLVWCDWADESGRERDWQAYLDAYRDHLEVVDRFGVWLSDRGDPRGPGYRALAALGRVPFATATSYPWAWPDELLKKYLPGGFYWWDWESVRGERDALEAGGLPRVWLAAVETPWVYYEGHAPGDKVRPGTPAKSKDFRLRRQADDAAARAWAGLTPAVRKQCGRAIRKFAEGRG